LLLSHQQPYIHYAAAAARLLSGGEADPGTLVPMLRDVSRQEYLKKREDAKLQELKDELEDAK
jgi:DNA-binding PadR family transcriptional regulator